MNEIQQLFTKSKSHLNTLCSEITERCVGSEGNRKATEFFRNELTRLGWETESQEFEAIDWKESGATLKVEDQDFRVYVSPYSMGCSAQAPLATVKNIHELETGNFESKIILLYSDIAKEQLMPKNFVFYNPESHQKIVSLLERTGAKAIICATGRNAALAGGVYPFPLIEDGDFDIPSVYMTEEEGEKLLKYSGSIVNLNSVSERFPGKGYNVIGRKGKPGQERIVITAHIDAKKGSPGAIDNATGVTVLLLLAELLKDYSGDKMIEVVAFNGEDYYAVPGQMTWIIANQDKFDNICLNINIDGVGYKEGKSSFSFFDLPDNIQKVADKLVKDNPELLEGPQWPQGDHSIFLQYGVPAIAVTSQWFLENMEKQDITHTPKDNLSIVSEEKTVTVALILKQLIEQLS